ncbi:MAG: MBL fold metallo-hydrolase [Chloroflexi bacterium]|nr:MBL fold metallo-hydrolase [Chloroflexota bacterium]
MKLGQIDVNIVPDGYFKLDGGVMFGQAPRVLWEKLVKPDRRNRIRLGLNCLLIQTPRQKILVDTGIGSKFNDSLKESYGVNASRLLRNLRAMGITAKDVTHVVLSHLHFDHCGGATKFNRKNQAVPTFPRAKYLVQRTAWEDALHPNERGRASFHKEDFLPLEARGQLTLLDGDAELAPGILLKVTNGHCRGHQIILVNHGGHRLAYFGDVIPTPHHLTLPYITALDQFPEETLDRKREFLALAEREGWLLTFGHGYDCSSGYLDRHRGQIRLRPFDLNDTAPAKKPG